MRAYYYNPQGAVVLEFLRSIGAMAHGARAPRSFARADDMRGLSGPQFMFSVVGHSQPLPNEVIELVIRLGWTWIDIDDTPARARYESLNTSAAK